MTSLRSRKPRHRKSLMRLRGRSRQNDCPLHGTRTNCICISSRGNSAIDKDADEHQESRKASDKTLESVNSNLTTETVCRHPSRKTSNPIPLIEREFVYEHPFEEVEESPQLVAVSDPFTGRFKAVSRSSRDSSSIYSLTDSQKPQNLHVYKRSRRPVICTDLDIMGSLSRESSLPKSCLDDGNWSDIFDRRKAAIAFNDLAIKLNLKPLPLSNTKGQGGGDCSHAHPTSGRLSVSPLTPFKEIADENFCRGYQSRGPATLRGGCLDGGIGSSVGSERCDRPSISRPRVCHRSENCVE
jgi:hypothetical protein